MKSRSGPRASTDSRRPFETHQAFAHCPRKHECTPATRHSPEPAPRRLPTQARGPKGSRGHSIRRSVAPKNSVVPYEKEIGMQRNRMSGFTLIELLVVIAILAILAAILFPVFAQARDQ